MKSVIFNWICLLIIIVMLLMAAFGCNVLKKTQRSTNDTVTVHKVDTIHLLKEDNNRKVDSSWWREIINLLPVKGADTVINNTTVPVYNYYPQQIIREGGTMTREELKRLIDSVASSRLDSSSVHHEAEQTYKKTQVLSMWQIIVLCFAACVVTALLSRLKIGFR